MASPCGLLYGKLSSTNDIHTYNYYSTAFARQAIHVQVKYQVWRQHHLEIEYFDIVKLIAYFNQFLSLAGISS